MECVRRICGLEVVTLGFTIWTLLAHGVFSLHILGCRSMVQQIKACLMQMPAHTLGCGDRIEC